MPDDIARSETHPSSGRLAIVAVERESVWLYLTDPAGTGIIADCWLANTGPALNREALKARTESYRSRDLPLPAPREVLTSGAHGGRAVPAGSALSFRWTADGDGVAVLVEGDLWGFIPPGARRGSSRDLIVEGPWGAPLDSERARILFDQHQSGGDQ